LFVPPFSCRGSELDLCAPGVAVIACQSPDGYAVCDGTSLAAAYVAALAALILADHADFKGSFAAKDGHRVERLFQILKDTAQPIGHPWQTGAGLPDAARALGVRSDQRPLAMSLNAGLREMRNAIRQLDRIPFSASQAMRFEPPVIWRLISSSSAGGKPSVGRSARGTHRISWPSSGRGVPRSVHR